MTTTAFSVDGMTCTNCVRHVTEELTALPGVTDVQIELNACGSSPVTVTSAAPLDDAAIAAAVDEAGYAVTPKGSLL